MAKIIYGIHCVWEYYQNQELKSVETLDRAFASEKDAEDYLSDPHLPELLHINPYDVEEVTTHCTVICDEDGDEIEYPFIAIHFKESPCGSWWSKCIVDIREIDFFG